MSPSSVNTVSRMARRAWKKLPRAKFDKVLEAIPEAAKKEAKEALRTSGKEAVRIIRGDTPFDEGGLIKSVNWSFGDPPIGMIGRSIKRRTKVPNELRISIWAGGVKAPHAHLVHNGTAERFTKTGASRGVMPAQPFFWPNIRSLRKRQKSRISRKARKAIRDAVK